MKKILLLIMVFSTILVTQSSLVKAHDGISNEFEEKRVLFISSYSSAFPTFFQQIDGLNDAFKKYPIIMDVEFMDSKRFFNEESLQLFYDTIEYKLTQTSYDLIITSDDNAINFVMEHRDALFTGLPVVFFGVNNVTNAVTYSNELDVTGVVEDISLQETIDLAVSLNKDIERVVGLFDNTTSGQSDLPRFYNLKPDYNDLEFYDIDMSELTFDEFLTEVALLENTDAVILFSALRDKDDVSYEFKESVALLLDASNQPIYHLFEHGIEEGLLGGKVVSHYEQGQTAAEIVISVFKGTDINEIDLVLNSPNVYLINYETFKQYGFDDNLLPEHTMFTHREYTLFEQYTLLFVFGILFLIAQTGIIGYLFIAVRKRNKAQDDLVQLNDQLHYKSNHDDLTGLFNRNFFEEQYPRLKYLDAPLEVSIVLVDVNGLKLINDAFGHIHGDEALIETANLLLKVFIDSDIFRIGGDEFAIIPYDRNEQEVNELIQELNEEMKKVTISGVGLSLSIGHATMTEGKSLREMFTEAEDWMYREKLNQVPSNRSAIINTIISTINEKDIYSEKHSKRVSDISVYIANLLNLNENRINEIKTAGLLHDIGKIIVPSHILNKESRLTKEEYEEIKKHSEIGYRILNSVSSMRDISEYVFCHHERPDGLGYPRGLKDKEIPMQSKVIALADAIDAMLTDRLYRSRLSKEACFKELKDNQGTQFDTDITQLVLDNFDDLYKFVERIYI